jgi:ABC-type multidrug transport system fused ATPase/permease subunit
MPKTLYGYILRYTARHQVGLATLAILVFALSTVPLELQRRIVNGLTEKSPFHAISLLVGAYAAVALVEQVLKLALNVYRGWVAETTVRALRRTASEGRASALPPEVDTGVEVAMVLEEAEPIGGFTALSISEPILQIGILVNVVGYMLFLQTELALIGLAFFLPQTFLVPLLQHAINRRASQRIVTKRVLSGTIVNEAGVSEAGAASGHPVDGAIDRIFRLNMGIYWLKYVMNLVMNAMHYLSVTAILGVGGWMVLEGRIEVGTVVAMVGGFAKLNDPWGDVVNWAREYSVVGVKYVLFRDAAGWLTGGFAGAGLPSAPAANDVSQRPSAPAA